MADTTVDNNRPVPQAPPPPPPPKVEPKAQTGAVEGAGDATGATSAVDKAPVRALSPAVVEGGAHAQQAAGERASAALGGDPIARVGEPAAPANDVSAADRARLYTPPAASAEAAALKPETAEGRAAVAGTLAERAGLNAEQAWKASKALDPGAVAQRETQIQTALVHTRDLPEGGIDTASGRVSYSAGERDAISKARSANPDERAKAIETAQTVAQRNAREHALDTAFGGPEGRAKVEQAHASMNTEERQRLDTLGAEADKAAKEPGFGDGFKAGAKDAITGIIDGVKTAYDVATNPEMQQKVQDVADALENPATRGAVIEAFRQQAGAGAEEFLAKGEKYVAGYLAGSAVASLGTGKLARHGAELLSDGVVKAARAALDVARRTEVKVNGLGSNGGNVSLSLRPHTASVNPATDRIANIDKLSKSERRVLTDNPIDNPRAFTTDFLKAGPHVKPTGQNKHIQVTTDPKGNVVLSSKEASADQVKAASLRLRGDERFRQRLIQETEAGLAQHGANLTQQKAAEARRLIEALRRFDAN